MNAKDAIRETLNLSHFALKTPSMSTIWPTPS